MKIKFEKPNKIKINKFDDHIGQVVKSVEGKHYIITRVAGRLYMVDTLDFHGSFIGETPNMYDEFELIESELIIHD